MSKPRVPCATYRLQFNSHFRFEDARKLVPYLQRLGISDLYSSPIFEARRGSLHGYDVTNPQFLNPELGTEQEFEAVVEGLKAHEMGLLLDIVPNHMAASSENQWWMDLLENGRHSPYQSFFDIDWDPVDRALQNKVLLPILGRPYRQALESQELALTLDETGLFVCYHGLRLPLNLKSYSSVLSHGISRLEETLGKGNPVFQQLKQLIETIERLPSYDSVDPREAAEKQRQRQTMKEGLCRIVDTSPELRAFLLENIALFNGTKGAPESFELLDSLLQQQVYRLAFWETGRDEINYRRFFDINDLIGVRVECPHVFEATHSLAYRLIEEGKVTGLRVDHIDGLYDPLQYLCRLQHGAEPELEGAVSPPGFYVIVEKILSIDEVLPTEWPVSGTTGYDFLNIANALFVDGKGFQALDSIYSQFTGSRVAFDDVVYEKKKQVMDQLFAGDARAMAHQLWRLGQQSSPNFHSSHKELTEALIGVTACLPVYRTYISTYAISPRDSYYLETAIREAQRRDPGIEARTLDFLKRVLFLGPPVDAGAEERELWLQFVMRWQQFASSVMAKGFEDTALYTYNRLISLNEVGGNPGAPGMTAEEFHRYMAARQANWPYTLNATSTHDTKRGEDVRARINVLSEIAEAWEQRVIQWNRWNHAKKQKVDSRLVPDPNIEILLYQTLVGAWPFSASEVPEFKERLKSYMVKAAREAREFTSWLSPNTEYENALIAFVESVLNDSDQNEFLVELLNFQRQVAYYGALNSLAQVMLKATSPGVPDFYQGTELWDLSLVDPDNRRPVDFQRRIGLLDDLRKQEATGESSLAQQLLASWEDGRVKLYLTHKALGTRRAYQDLFLDGDYIPLQVQGQRREHVCAFARRRGTAWALTAVPRLLTSLVSVGQLPLGQRVWGDDSLPLPDDAPGRWADVFTGEILQASPKVKVLPLSRIFGLFPVSLLMGTASDTGREEKARPSA